MICGFVLMNGILIFYSVWIESFSSLLLYWRSRSLRCIVSPWLRFPRRLFRCLSKCYSHISIALRPSFKRLPSFFLNDSPLWNALSFGHCRSISSHSSSFTRRFFSPERYESVLPASLCIVPYSAEFHPVLSTFKTAPYFSSNHSFRRFPFLNTQLASWPLFLHCLWLFLLHSSSPHWTHVETTTFCFSRSGL